MMVRILVPGGAMLAMLIAAAPAEAAVEARVSLATQRMTVLVDGAVAYDWPVSTGRKGYGTPTGKYRALRTAATYYSRKYHRSPMPYSVFFAEGYAVHGTTEIRRLGRPASHGCVRLHPDNAATLYTLVREQGLKNSHIVIGD